MIYLTPSEKKIWWSGFFGGVATAILIIMVVSQIAR
jgi:hypothetical protein